MKLAVYSAIAAVQAELATQGISKDRKNQQQGYTFRGIDDIFNALAPLLSRHGLVILPRVVSREVVERTTAKGNALFYVTVHVEFDFVSSEDGSKHVVVVYGEAMDSADKATNKAMSAAYKYAALQAFCIPTEGDNDADAHTPEPVKPRTFVKLADTVPTTTATSEPAPTLRELAERAGVDPARICAHYSVETLDDLTDEQRHEATNKLRARLPKG